LNSRKLASVSAVHLFMISSSVLPLSIDGGATARDTAVFAVMRNLEVIDFFV
jgi:hypothetical protein